MGELVKILKMKVVDLRILFP